ncbi:pectin lyase-like protein [Aureobasidium melanogenum CBS 110374]|uniref:pectinesterase n=1 Tax=Aureobasidium melanogenum (strain CBS 110374) TaxID=1043003 RepID=A0A074VG92_AURM1|nr:pectin lyase-like protein [Aureobasidium melanogenum CBS 110374]KEQ58004.1 pectin lyase-like protein [Aureobasidium melanogenum CBS 110374]
MRTSILSSAFGLAALAACQNSTIGSSIFASSTTSLIVSSSSSSSLVSSASTTIASSSTSSPLATAITVALDGSAQFTAINAAVNAAQNSGVPTVVVKAGTYSESVAILGSQTVTIIGPTASSVAQNQVNIIASGANGVVSITSTNTGITLKNLNLTNLATSGTAPALYVRGSKHGIYNCALISSSTGLYFSSFGTALIANSYLEGPDKLFANYPTVYVYGSTIVPTASNALIMYGKGYAPGTTTAGNATLVVDSSSVVQKAGLSNSYVYLAAPNANYTQAIFRNNNLGSLIAPSGFYVGSCNYAAYYGDISSANSTPSSTTMSVSSSIVSQNATPYTIYIEPVTLNQVKDEQTPVINAKKTNDNSADFYGNNMAAYGCSFIVFSNCYVEGSIDFIWGFGTAYFYRSVIASNTKGACVTAQGRVCLVTYTSTYGNTSYATHINAAEYNNTGPGAWISGTARVSFATNMTADQVAGYSLSAWPSWSFPASTTTGSASSTSSGVPGPTSTSSVNAHPDSGSVPPQYAVIVSADGQHNASFTNLTAALASLPNDSSYNEQIPSINRPGAIRDNSVTVTFARGFDAETATIATASNRISFYNINFVNSDNRDGLEASYVTLAASIYGNDIGFYGCSFQGWQDTLLTGATTGYHFFKGCTIGAKRQKSAMTAQSRASSSAIVYLGRPYSAYALVVVKNSYLDDVINPSGWKYNNVGPGSWANNVAARQAFGNATLLTSDTYTLDSVMDDTVWIDKTYWISGSSSYNGTVPPNGALIVSKNAIDGTNATIFIYPGVYEEQLTVNKSGTTIFMGYSDSTDDYSKNQVTIQQSYDAATVYATGNYFYAYNQNIASLGFAIYGNQDTLYISGNMFTFKSYIEGNVDFIFGAGSGYFLNSTISPNEDGDSITAAKRATNTTSAGFVFDQCTINVSLGRPWNNFALGSAGWAQWSKSSPQTDGVTFAEYHNFGPGSNTCNHVGQFQLANFFPTTSSSSSILSTTSSSSSTTLPLITTQGDITSTLVTYVTENDGTTVTPSPILKTSIVKSTDIVTSTTTKAGKTTTVKSTSDVTIKQTSIVSSETTIAGKDTTIKSTETDCFATTVAGKTSTVKATSTLLVTSTIGSVVTVYETSTLKAPDVTSSTTLKPSTVTVSSFSVKTTTKGTTITASCVPTAARAAGTTTIFISTTLTSYIKTSVITSAGSTIFTSAATSTVLSTLLATSTELVTESAVDATATSIIFLAYSTDIATVSSTEKISADAATTTLPASTTTIVKTSSLKGNTIEVTVTPAPTTKTTTVKSTSTVFTTVTKTAKNAPACTD